MIAFKDFSPERTSFQDATYSTLEDCIAKANVWIGEQGVRVFNIETIVLPNIFDEGGPEDVSLRTPPDAINTWHQFIRVWYET